jgi:hypothetical protein
MIIHNDIIQAKKNKNICCLKGTECVCFPLIQQQKKNKKKRINTQIIMKIITN